MAPVLVGALGSARQSAGSARRRPGLGASERDRRRSAVRGADHDGTQPGGRRPHRAGKVLVPLLFLVLVVGPILTILLSTVVGPVARRTCSSANLGIVRFVVAITGILLFSIPAAFIIIYMELKVIAFMNLRIGPDRVGPKGALHSVVAGLKVLTKEDFTPTGADRDRVHVGAGASCS